MKRSQLRALIASLVLLLMWAPLSAAQEAETGEEKFQAKNDQVEKITDEVTATDLVQTEMQVKAILEGGLEKTLSPENARTPMQLLLGMRKSIDEQDLDTAAQYLDLRYLPDEVAEVEPELLFRALIFVWRQENLLNLVDISNDPEGKQDDGLPSYRDSLGEVHLSEGVVPILAQRIPDGNGDKVWRISNATVALIPQMWEEHGFSDYALWLADTLPRFQFLGMDNWQVVSLGVSLIAFWYVAGAITGLLVLASRRAPQHLPAGIVRFWQIPTRVILYVIMIRVVVDHLGLSVVAKIYLQSSPLEYIAVTIFLTGLISLWRDIKIRQLESRGDVHFVALLKPLALIIRILIVLTAALLWARDAGFNVSTLIAGLGVGSLAVALAAQKTLENVIGAITLYAARPIKPGDLCRFGKYVGHVEEIGLRSVTLRTLERTEISIPNSMFSSTDIENISGRDRIRFYRHLQLQMPTSDQLRVILAELRALYLSHPKVLQPSVSIRLEKIEAATAVLRLDAQVLTRDYQEYLAVIEDLNLRIIETVHSNGAIFSGAGQVLQVRDFYQADEETMRTVSDKLEDWRDRNELPFPDWSETQKAEFRGAIEYPPPGHPPK